MEPFQVARELSDSSFYHVTGDADLPLIARNGLRPGSAVGRCNFPAQGGMDKECVYIWPNIGQALSYVFDDSQKFGEGKHRLLRLGGLDQSRIYPDNERLGDELHDEAWSVFEHDEEPGAYMEVLMEAGWSREALGAAFNTKVDYGNGDQFPRQHMAAAAAEILKKCSDDVRLRLVEMFLERGDALMYRGDIPAASIELATLLDVETLRETFDSQHPELDPWQGDDYDEELETRQIEEFDAWINELLSDGCELPPEKEVLQNMICDPSECVDNSHERFFTFESLDALGLTLAPPVLAPLEPTQQPSGVARPSAMQQTLSDNGLHHSM